MRAVTLGSVSVLSPFKLGGCIWKFLMRICVGYVISMQPFRWISLCHSWLTSSVPCLVLMKSEDKRFDRLENNNASLIKLGDWGTVIVPVVKKVKSFFFFFPGEGKIDISDSFPSLPSCGKAEAFSLRWNCLLQSWSGRWKSLSVIKWGFQKKMKPLALEEGCWIHSC